MLQFPRLMPLPVYGKRMLCVLAVSIGFGPFLALFWFCRVALRAMSPCELVIMDWLNGPRLLVRLLARSARRFWMSSLFLANDWLISFLVSSLFCCASLICTSYFSLTSGASSSRCCWWIADIMRFFFFCFSDSSKASAMVFYFLTGFPSSPSSSPFFSSLAPTSSYIILYSFFIYGEFISFCSFVS